MAKYSTISVPEEIKEALEQNKGNKEWGEYLMELYKKAEEERKRQAFTKLTDILSDEDYENMKKTSEKFREEFKLR